jgi:DNA-binding response OmpR family regulator
MRDVEVLLVEDHAALAGLYAIGLEGEGYVVTVAPDGLTALKLARADEPDLIVLDIGLPELDGLGVLELLRAGSQTQAIPVLVFSSCDDPETVRRAFELGATDYLLKSDTTPRQLAQQVRRVIGDADARSSLR